MARTTWVRQAFTALTGMPSRLLAFSDDMDGLRKVPDNVPNREMLAGYLGQPLTRVPDPFGTHESFGAHNNARLRAFLDGFGFEYEFASSTEYYASGRFDAALLRGGGSGMSEIVAAILPTLGPERRATYSPFLPIHPRTGPGHAGADRRGGRRRPARSRGGPGDGRAVRDAGDAAGRASCSGRRTGRCAGTRSASTTRCRART